MPSYDRPIKAALYVHLDNGESWEASDEDLRRFGLTRTNEAYMRFRTALAETLEASGLLPTGDLVDAHINPLRYLAEVAICYPDDLRLHHGADIQWSGVADIERRLADLHASHLDAADA